MLITEFVGLRSKMYSYIKDNKKEGKTAKGIKKNIIKNEIKHKDYKNVLINNKQIHHTMKTIRSINHQLDNSEAMNLIKYLSVVLMTNVIFIMME